MKKIQTVKEMIDYLNTFDPDTPLYEESFDHTGNLDLRENMIFQKMHLVKNKDSIDFSYKNEENSYVALVNIDYDSRVRKTWGFYVKSDFWFRTWLV